jgi:hypothetical protein
MEFALLKIIFLTCYFKDPDMKRLFALVLVAFAFTAVAPVTNAVAADESAPVAATDNGVAAPAKHTAKHHKKGKKAHHKKHGGKKGHHKKKSAAPSAAPAAAAGQ